MLRTPTSRTGMVRNVALLYYSVIGATFSNPATRSILFSRSSLFQILNFRSPALASLSDRTVSFDGSQQE